MIGSCGPTTAAPRSPRQGTFVGQIGIGGARKLYLRCAGRGSPTVILEWNSRFLRPVHSDRHDIPDALVPVLFTGVSRFTHVCRYDRPGTIRHIKRLFGSLWPAYDHLLNFPRTTLDSAPGWERIDIDGAVRAVQRARPLLIFDRVRALGRR